jgi:hypothetical protein
MVRMDGLDSDSLFCIVRELSLTTTIVLSIEQESMIAFAQNIDVRSWALADSIKSTSELVNSVLLVDHVHVTVCFLLGPSIIRHFTISRFQNLLCLHFLKHLLSQAFWRNGCC